MQVPIRMCVHVINVHRRFIIVTRRCAGMHIFSMPRTKIKSEKKIYIFRLLSYYNIVAHFFVKRITYNVYIFQEPSYYIRRNMHTIVQANIIVILQVAFVYMILIKCIINYVPTYRYIRHIHKYTYKYGCFIYFLF